MKYLGFIFFLITTAWTWHVVHRTPEVSFETHASIQEKLSELLLENIKAKKPTASDVQVTKMWTETLQNGKVKAHFAYSFKENSEETGSLWNSIQGEGVLEKQVSPTKGDGDTQSSTENPLETSNRWILSQVKVTEDNVKFDDGLVITADPQN